jgi:hypothetical protein
MKFELATKEPWMEKSFLIDDIKKLSSTGTVKKTLCQLGYPNIESAKRSLKRLGKKFGMDIRVEEKEGNVYVFNH